MTLLDQLLFDLGACPEARLWASTQPDLGTAWRVCNRGDWMLWLVGRVSQDRSRLVLAACDCAELSLPLIRDEWELSIAEATLEITRAWAHGEATIEQVQEARRACYTTNNDVVAVTYAAATVRSRVFRQCADIIRDHYPLPPVVQMTQSQN